MLKDQYATLTTDASCSDGEVACVQELVERQYLTWSCMSILERVASGDLHLWTTHKGSLELASLEDILLWVA